MKWYWWLFFQWQWAQRPMEPITVLFRKTFSVSVNKLNFNDNLLNHWVYKYYNQYNWDKFVTFKKDQQLTINDLNEKVASDLNNVYLSKKTTNFFDLKSKDLTFFFHKDLANKPNLKKFVKDNILQNPNETMNYWNPQNLVIQNDHSFKWDCSTEGGWEIKALLSKSTALIFQTKGQWEYNNYLHNKNSFLWSNSLFCQFPLKSFYCFLGFGLDFLLFSHKAFGNYSHYYNNGQPQSFDMRESIKFSWLLGFQWNKKKYFFYDYRWFLKFSFLVSFREILYWMGCLVGLSLGQWRNYENLRPKTTGLLLNVSL
jgi:hypothetical protein